MSQRLLVLGSAIGPLNLTLTSDSMPPSKSNAKKESGRAKKAENEVG